MKNQKPVRLGEFRMLGKEGLRKFVGVEIGVITGRTSEVYRERIDWRQRKHLVFKGKFKKGVFWADLFYVSFEI